MSTPPMPKPLYEEWDHAIDWLDRLRIRSGNYTYAPMTINQMKRARNLLDAIIYAHEEDAA